MRSDHEHPERVVVSAYRGVEISHAARPLVRGAIEREINARQLRPALPSPQAR
jgi:hypothetical protein